MGLFSKFNNKQNEFIKEGARGNQGPQMAQGYNPYTGNVRISPNVPSYNMQNTQQQRPSYSFEQATARSTTGFAPNPLENQQNYNNNFVQNYNNPMNRPVQNPNSTVNVVEKQTPNQNPYRSFNDNQNAQANQNPQPAVKTNDPYSALNPSQIAGQNSPINQVKIDVKPKFEPEANKPKLSINSLQDKINNNSPTTPSVENKVMDEEIEKEFNKLFDSGELDSKNPEEGLSLDINDNESLNLEIGNTVKPEVKRGRPSLKNVKNEVSSLPRDDKDDMDELERQLEAKFDELFNSNKEDSKTNSDDLSDDDHKVSGTDSKEIYKLNVEINNKLGKILESLYGDVSKAQARKAKTELKSTFLGLMDKLDDAIREKELAIKEKEQRVKEAARKAREAAALEKAKAAQKVKAAKEKERAKATKKVTTSKKTTKSKASKTKATPKKATKKVTPKKTATKKATKAKAKKTTTAKKTTKTTKAVKSTRGRKKSK